MAAHPPIGVVICGVTGRMGGETALAVAHDSELRLLGAVTRKGGPSLAIAGRTIPAAASLPELLQRCQPACVVDFTVAEPALANGREALGRSLAFVTGTTGMSESALDELRQLAARHGAGCVIAPNFAIGAVLAAHFASIAARHFAWAEVIELHHEQKADAPSGTALATVRAMAAARGQRFLETSVTKQTLPGTRGGEVEGIHVHSVRLPGLVAHQEVLLGGQGEVLTIRHDSMSRASFMPGVLLAIKHATRTPGFVYGVGPLLGI